LAYGSTVVIAIFISILGNIKLKERRMLRGSNENGGQEAIDITTKHSEDTILWLFICQFTHLILKDKIEQIN
jgi:hypothetical protein